MQEQELQWTNWDEAMKHVQAQSDASLQQFVMRAVMLVVRRSTTGQHPAQKLDMLYYVELMVELYSQKDDLKRIFDGEDLRWFADEP